MARILGIGTEITECLRIARMIEQHGEQFVDRVYTPAEVRYCQGQPQSTQHFAARWVAKQAIPSRALAHRIDEAGGGLGPTWKSAAIPRAGRRWQLAARSKT